MRRKDRMQQLKLTNSRYALVDDEDYERCRIFKWGFNPAFSGSIVRTTNAIILSHFILNYTGNLTIDHKDRNPYNNQKENLREATRQQQIYNRNKFNNVYTSNYKGVYWNKQLKCWHARIGLNCKRIHLGFFSKESNAAKAYNDAAIKYHKEFAVLNVISPET